MKLAYVGLKFDYAILQNGDSYEFNNIEAGIKDCANRGMFEASYYHPDVPGEMELLRKSLSEITHIIHVEFNDQFDLPEDIALEAIRLGKAVICWSSDASYRFHNWILPRKNRYTHFITTHNDTIPWYKQNGMNVIKSQWGGSPIYIRDDSLPKIYSISFIGQCHGHGTGGKMLRRQIMDAMYNNGVGPDVWGKFWDDPTPYEKWHGYANSWSEMIGIMNSSKIGLNLLNGWAINQLGQIKGRVFEIPQLGLMQLTTTADDLEAYFEPNKEIVIVRTMQELIDKAKYYLNNGSERVKIAEAGYQRMLKEHQWHHRIEKILKEL